MPAKESHYVTQSVFGLISIAFRIVGRPCKVRRSDVHVLHELPSNGAQTSVESDGGESAEDAAKSAFIHGFHDLRYEERITMGIN